MTQPLVISNQPPEYPGMNFALLRQEGIKYIEQLAGKIWTDYNTHDPGITILEQLCYAITDLSYRLSFDIKDLLAYPSNTPAKSQKQFFTAREILTVNPLTINDYRKLIIDIDGVKNAWLEIVDDLVIYYDTKRNILTIASNEFTEQLTLNGLYRVLIEKDKGFDNEALEQQVKLKLHQHRNLCEDFQQIKVLPVEEISIIAEIEIADGFDVNEIMAQIYFSLDNFISPSIHFLTLREMLEKGKTPEEIFNGAPLEHGFIDEEQLQQFSRKNELYASDLIQIILDIEGVKVIKSLLLSNSSSILPEAWVLELSPDTTPQIQSIDAIANSISFYKGQITYSLDIDEIKTKLNSLQKEKAQSYNIAHQDIPIPIGEYRELSDYESIQNEFPANYGIGELGLPASASAQRKAQAKQLQAYLAFFDQVLANYFAQLDHFKDLFSFQNQENKTYFSQSISYFPGLKEILTEHPEESTQNSEKIDIDRKNRLLDHLLAQFSEKFTDYSLLLYKSIIPENQSPSSKLIEDKVTFLQDYLAISSARGQAFNYTNNISDTENISGLKRRISRLLSIPYTQQSLTSDDIEGFHILEHTLLRPRSSKTPNQPTDFLILSSNVKYYDPYSFQISFIFPNWVKRLKPENENFRQLIYNTLLTETPAHISINCHWLDKDKMQAFETAREQLLNMLVENNTNSADFKATANRIIELLQIGSTDIPPVTGNVTIGDDFTVS